MGFILAFKGLSEFHGISGQDKQSVLPKLIYLYTPESHRDVRRTDLNFMKVGMCL